MFNQIVRRTVCCQDFFGKETQFIIVWECVFAGYTFAVGIDVNKTNEWSIFEVTNFGLTDHYHVLDTGFLDVYNLYNFSILDKVMKEIKKVVIERLTNRVKCGTITMEQAIKIVEKECES